MKQFIAIANSTIWDVCLNTYGTTEYIVKLMIDNDFDGVDNYPVAGQIFMYDETLVANLSQQITTASVNLGQIKYATKNNILN